MALIHLLLSCDRDGSISKSFRADHGLFISLEVYDEENDNSALALTTMVKQEGHIVKL